MAQGKVEIDATLKDSGVTSGLNSLSSKVGGIASKIGTGLIAATTAGVGAVASLTSKSVQAYGEYEQMVGGVQKLYGNMGMSLEEYAASVGKSTDEVAGEWQQLESAQNMVLENAKNAYATAGMSMNEYMDLATQFSAALINSLGGDTVAAAEKTDVAIRAISDNVNTMGSNVEDVSNAFKGFAKQNYTMLDNLKLGYGGTKSEMERLISDANEYAKSMGRAGDLSIDSFADVIDAIQLVQEKQNIAGTTAREAATTYQGSLKMMQASWENLLIVMADPKGDMTVAIDRFVESAGTFLNNALPIIEQAMLGIASMIEQLAPMIAERLPPLIAEILPKLINAASQIVSALAQALPSIMSGVWEAVTSNGETAATVFGIGLLKGAPSIMSAADKTFNISGKATEQLQKLPGIAGSAMSSVASKLSNSSIGSSILGTFSSIGSSIGSVFTRVGTTISGVFSSIGKGMLAFITSPVGIVIAIIGALIALIVTAYNTNEEFRAKVDAFLAELGQAVQPLVEMIMSFVQQLADMLMPFIQQLIEMLIPFITQLAETLIPVITEILSVVMQVASTLLEMLMPVLSSILEAIMPLIEILMATLLPIIQTLMEVLLPIIELLMNILLPVIQMYLSILTPIVEFLCNLLVPAIQFVADVITLICQILTGDFSGAAETFQNILNGIAEFWTNIWGQIWDLIVQIFGNIVMWIGECATNILNNINNFFGQIPGNIANFLGQALSSAISWAGEMASAAWNAASQMFNNIANCLSSLPDHVGQIGRNLVIGIWNGIAGMGSWLTDRISSWANGCIDSIKSFFGIHSPSVVMRDVIGKNLAKGIAVGFEMENPLDLISGSITNSLGAIQTDLSLNSSNAQQKMADSPSQVFNFNDVQTSPDSIYQKFHQTQTYGMARSF